ncbi:transcriptional regulator ATRX homolog isoform X3 [Trichoplusia ni]|uniref:Transcriptional regulator ATRX homolog isoform X3 n=1 Tax=Trichoplusia ni TaxID=7111 RepID=A0A7E5VQY1_TRINI|nr:transcriptional regulator ATRX homolog isoform X3 [Trichoplusia ni]
MAAEVPVSVVLCEAMEYLSKLGANLRTRSENLKDKRINKDKLKNAHAVHKAASKVLLICELSKKSLEKVENCVQSVISRVDASQAPSNVGGKSQEKPKFYYFEYDTHKLRISKKISIKHYTSAKVVAKSMTISMHDNYPVYYDCKLKRLRVGTSDFKSRKLANIDFETNQGKSDSNQNEIVDVESDDAKTEMAENSSDVTKSTQNTAECTSTNSDRRKPLRIMSISDTEDDIVPLATKSSNSVSTEDSVSKLVSDENKSEDSSATTENNNVDHTESLVKEHRESHSGPEDGKVSTEESSKKKSTKGGPITIFFNRKNTVKKSKTNGQQKNSSQILPVDDTNSEEDFKSNKNKEAQKENKPASNEANCSSDNLEPIKRKRKNSNVSDSSSQINDDSTKNSEENNMQKELNDDSNDSNNSKPLIRCVNITKLLKPDAVPVKSDLFAGKQSDIREHFSKKGSAQVHSKEESKIYNLGNKESSKSMIIKNKSNWDSKLKEVKNFKLKKFSLNVERLPELSTKFLLDHNLIRIIQGGHTVCEVRKDEAKSDTYMKKVKNALLNDSESDDSVKAQSKRVKHSLLNDSDSDKEIGTNIDSQVVSQKEINPATIKDSLLCDSDSDKNEEQVVKENSKVSDGNTNNSQERIDTVVENIIASLSRLNEHSAQNQEKSDDSSLKSYVNKENDNHNVSETEKLNEPCHDTIKAKSSLLNDSDSDSEPFPRTKERFISARESSELKKMLLNHSSSSEHEESVTNVLKRGRKKSRSSNSSSSETAKSKKTACSEKAHNSSINQIDGTVDEHSDSSVKKMVRSKSKPSGSSVQNSEIQDASDRDIEGLTNLNSLNKSRRHGSSSNNTESRSSARQACKLKQTPTIGEDLLHAESSSDVSENNVDENVEEEDLPKIHGLNGDSIGHLAKDDLLNESDSSASQDVEATEDTQHIEDSEEENVISKRRKANAISSDSEGGTSRRKHEDDEEARVSDFEDSEDESSESAKRSKRKKKPSESDGSAGSSNEGKKKRRRIKQVNDSDGSGSDTENEGRNKHGRKNIRKVMGKNQLEEATKKAAREEKERIARIADRQKLYNNLDFDETGKPDEVVLEKVVLDFDPETKEPLIQVDRGLVKKLKPHQANGIKFMWDACFESAKRIKKDRGSGCILAHCMGLGKTLQVISLTHTLLTHGSLTNVNRVLVVCPLSTVLNWVNEIRMWLKHAESDFEVDIYELSRYKQNSERAFQLQQWLDNGGVCVLGYEMFRNLSADNPKKFKKKMLRSFQESLVDPGPDLVVCDEGHLLKNEKTSLSQSMNRVKTRRRIVLTGTPLQNNLKEYYCMVQFVKPNLLGKYNEYLNRFVNPITNGQYTDSTEHDIRIMKRRSHVLHKMLDGAVQRRDYGVLAPFLPPKHEYVLFITLTDVQVKLYQHYLDNYSRRPLPGKSGFLFPDFQSLQRIWTHPLVLKYNSERYEIMQQKKREREEEDSEGSLVDFIDDDSTPDETSTEESTDDSSELSDDSRKKSKKKKSGKKDKKGKEAKVGTRRGTRANPVEADDDDPDVAEVFEVKNENPTEWWIKLVEDEELDDMRNSHKLVLLFDILRQCEAIGDKLLVFSQSLYSLDLIEHFLGKVDEATQEGRIDEKLGGHVGSWSPGVDYFRLDGSTSCENRSIWCKNFNREDNPRARLFLISTRAGGLGINLVAANRVIIFDVSWNPSHDVQSIFRVYRFGQKKPCYVYRFLAMGTMEEKIYERQVTKQAISKRVIDEQQIDRHYAENDLAELYKFEARPDEPRPLPTLPRDRLFAEMLKEHEAQIYKYHEHDSLLENKEEETLSEEERKAAWEDFENEKNKPPPTPFPSAWPMHNGMVPGLLAQQQQQLAYAALAAMLRKDMPNINDNQIRDMLPLIYNSNPGLMQKMGEIYKYAQPGVMNPGMMNPVMNAVTCVCSSGQRRRRGRAGRRQRPAVRAALAAAASAAATAAPAAAHAA